eukprot:1380418-Amorphochlora_amoeboformis.AAC.2
MSHGYGRMSSPSWVALLRALFFSRSALVQVLLSSSLQAGSPQARAFPGRDIESLGGPFRLLSTSSRFCRIIHRENGSTVTICSLCVTLERLEGAVRRGSKTPKRSLRGSPRNHLDIVGHYRDLPEDEFVGNLGDSPNFHTRKIHVHTRRHVLGPSSYSAAT